MGYHCFKCQAEQQIGRPTEVGRRDTCEHCGSDLHACLNCIHYDVQAYNGCREPQAERVVDKDRSNFCDYFVFREGKAHLGKTGTSKSHRINRLDDLFKK